MGRLGHLEEEALPGLLEQQVLLALDLQGLLVRLVLQV